MVCYIYAYVKVDQEVAEGVVKESLLERKDRMNRKKLARLLGIRLDIPEQAIVQMSLSYLFNETLKMHELYSKHLTTFVKEDAKCRNVRWRDNQATLRGRDFPPVLNNLNFNVSRPKDALEAADAIEIFLADDTRYVELGKWFKLTAKYCTYYHLKGLHF